MLKAKKSAKAIVPGQDNWSINVPVLDAAGLPVTNPDGSAKTVGFRDHHQWLAGQGRQL